MPHDTNQDTAENTSRQLVALSGDQTVRQSARTHAEILSALGAPGDLVLDCTGVTEADLSLVQIILAAHRSARADGRHVVLSAPPEGALRNALERGGFLDLGATDPACWTSRGAVP
jgi:anti-anti-sigma regulatory factor